MERISPPKSSQHHECKEDSMKQTVETDIAIIGGGIAGLWLLNRLRQQGYSVILLESGTLGGGQTNKAQGILHGGVKYALQGALTPSANAIADMPMIWKQCLEGYGEINLSHVPVLSQQQYLWSNGGLTSKLTAFFAGLALKSNMQSLSKESFPEFFKHSDFQGQVYSLDEMVIDVPAVVRELMKPHQDVIFKIDPIEEDQLQLDENNCLVSLTIKAEPLPPLQVHAQKFIFTGGAGNALVLKKLKQPSISMQKRPLHMVLVKHEITSPLYAHCLGLSSTPRITITTHKSHDGKPVWYLGGQIAEDGTNRSAEAQIAFAKKELAELFPWLDFSTAEFSSFFIERAESQQPGGGRPESCYAKEIQNMLIAWPTKMALAPQLAKEIIQQLSTSGIKPRTADMRELRAWPIPALAKPIWDQVFKCAPEPKVKLTVVEV
jgi:glycerol-3-phosphate dehydrogenase